MGKIVMILFLFKSDERILGDSDFVDAVLKSADEKLQRRYALEAEGWNLDKLAEKVSVIYDRANNIR